MLQLLYHTIDSHFIRQSHRDGNSDMDSLLTQVFSEQEKSAIGAERHMLCEIQLADISRRSCGRRHTSHRVFSMRQYLLRSQVVKEMVPMQSRDRDVKVSYRISQSPGNL